MSLFNRWKGRLPVVSVTSETRDQVSDRITALGASPTTEQTVEAVVNMVDEILRPPSREFIAASKVNEAEFNMFLYMSFWAGCAGALAEASGWEKAMERTEALSLGLREYVAFGQREYYDRGPIPLIQYAQASVSGTTDAVDATLAVMAQFLCVAERKGGMEGWHRVGILAWMAGELAGEAMSAEVLP
jgi:hypothetical protein